VTWLYETPHTRTDRGELCGLPCRLGFLGFERTGGLVGQMEREWSRMQLSYEEQGERPSPSSVPSRGFGNSASAFKCRICVVGSGVCLGRGWALSFRTSLIVDSHWVTLYVYLGEDLPRHRRSSMRESSGHRPILIPVTAWQELGRADVAQWVMRLLSF